MQTFREFLDARFASGGFTTEDALVAFLPLLRQVIEAHQADLVAPLQGVDALRVEGGRIWFEVAARAQPTDNRSRIRKFDAEATSGVEVLNERRRTLNVSTGAEEVHDVSVREDAEESLDRPVYLPNYRAWEHVVGHHDEMTDVFSLGMILASLACCLDFHNVGELREFVGHRENLFRLRPGLHPALAKAIVRMTELSRHGRPADLRRLLHSLENYRSYEVDFEYDLKCDKEFDARDRAGRQQLILAKLQERLFNLSRANRLLHFRPSMSLLNLTEASVPLSFSVDTIRPDQILTWGGKFADELLRGKPVCLNGYMNFDEVLYLGPTLDRIRTEALRDKAEYGFSQLKLAICFLRWADLKSDPPEAYDSPLTLLPVTLTKRKGIRDTYWIEAASTEAETNPVVRHRLRQLYDIRLPETMELDAKTLEGLHAELAQQIARSDKTVELRQVRRPRIDLLHDKARRRLDVYRRRARVAGRGVRQFLDIDYSYDPANFHPLGLQVFSSRVRPTTSRLQHILQEKPAAKQYMVAEPPRAAVEAERRFFSLRDGGENPCAWEFDVCRVTLGNFRYRKMTLVKDYEALLAGEHRNEPFDASFSLTPPSDPPAVAPLPLADRYQVVPCDPTQASAVALARAGLSYIIQGPPGTGKSQTITNLIADFIARGKRVLFVCEKRAAIDIVHQRLKERGLGELCCLIHDSQGDKREFVRDLKEASERFTDSPGLSWGNRRRRLVGEFERELAPLRSFVEAAVAQDERAGMPIKDLLCRAVEMRDAMPELTPLQQERLPDYAEWLASRKTIGAVLDVLRDVSDDGTLASHPLAALHPRVAEHDRPLAWVSECLERCDELLGAARRAVEQASVGDVEAEPIGSLAGLLGLLAVAEPVVRRNLYALANPTSRLSDRFDQTVATWQSGQATATEAREKTEHWRQPLSTDEVEAALDVARRTDSGFLRFLSPAWWQLRKALNTCYDFNKHAVRPTRVRILENLQTAQAAERAAEELRRGLRDRFGLPDEVVEFVATVQRLRAETAELTGTRRRWHERLLSGEIQARGLVGMGNARRKLLALARLLDELLGDCNGLTLDDVADRLMLVEESLDQLPDILHCLKNVGRLPTGLATAFRTLPVSPTALEAAIIRQTLEKILRARPALRRFGGTTRAAQVARLALLNDMWQDVNASAVGEEARRAYCRLRQVASTPAAQLAPEQRELKNALNAGRRELAHEFGKQMRHKPIRSLVAGNSGLLIRGLKPVWLMSPLSVSDTLPLDGEPFDVVIFDEASQITLEEAVPTLFRGRQAIVVGDEMQLPPTSFFSSRSDGEDELFSFTDEDGQAAEYDLSCNSFLNHAARNLPSVMLGWHYRSRSESLISFSNSAFYQRRLLTVPDEDRSSRHLEEIVAESPEDGATGARQLLRRSVSFHFVGNGVYDNRRNRPEADYVAHLVRGLLRARPRRSIGIVAFSEAQQGEIERALDRLAGRDEAFATELELEYERELDGQFVGLLVKNLENIQGDERDVIIMSVCYGHDPDGRMRMNFGPINQTGGEKRLNVAFSRARHHMALVSSIRHPDIRNDHNDGARCLKNYLRYAAACSTNDLAGTERVLDELAPRATDAAGPTSAAMNPVVREIKAWLERRGYEVDLDVGMSHFRCDMAVRPSAGEPYCLGILFDGDRYYRQDDDLERDLFKPALLRAFGWRLTTVLTKDYYENADAVRARIDRALAGEDTEADGQGGLDVYRQHIESLLGAETHPDDMPTLDPVADDAPSDPPGGMEAEALPENQPVYLEYVGGSSSKFWEVTLSGDRYSVRFGRIGTTGQERVKTYRDAATARREAIRALQSKQAKGYREKPRP